MLAPWNATIGPVSWRITRREANVEPGCAKLSKTTVLLLTGLSTKASSSSSAVPSVGCLPAIDTGFSVCVLVTHIPCVCACQHLPKPATWRADGKVLHLWSLFTRITVFLHMQSNARQFCTFAGFRRREIDVTLRTDTSRGAGNMSTRSNEDVMRPQGGFVIHRFPGSTNNLCLVDCDATTGI